MIKGLIKKQKTHKLIVLLLLLKFSALHALLEASASASVPNLPLLVIAVASMLARIVLMVVCPLFYANKLELLKLNFFTY